MVDDLTKDASNPSPRPLCRRSFIRSMGAVAYGFGTAGCMSNESFNLDGEAQRYPPPAEVSTAPAFRPHSDIENPVLTADAVSDREFVLYVADPFIAFDGDNYHMFFEVFYDSEVSADVGHATSEDGLHWEYNQIVLDDPYHLAYPHVFEWDGEWYMTPDKATFDYNGIPEFRIYRGDPFPTNWTLEERAVINEHFGDPTPIRLEDTWYLFSVEQESTNGTRLHYADTLLDGEWTEHLASPVFTEARNFRPAGRPVVSGGNIYIFIQDVERTYGDKVRCFRVDTLTKEEYAHAEIEDSPVIQATHDGSWNGDGMHHVDATLAYRGRKNIVAVDGKNSDGRWSLGIYEHVGVDV